MECGWPAYAVVPFSGSAALVAFVALGLAVARLRVALIAGGFAVAIAFGAIGIGVLGTFLGERKVDRALANAAVEPEYHERIKAMGYSEAGQCTRIGVSLGGVPLGLAALALVLALVRSKRAAARSPRD
jgi:hypothetical protein